MSASVNALIEEYPFGSFTYTYYEFVSKFHVMPETWQDIFEYLEYTKTENKIKECVANAQTK